MDALAGSTPAAGTMDNNTDYRVILLVCLAVLVALIFVVSIYLATTEDVTPGGIGIVLRASGRM